MRKITQEEFDEVCTNNRIRNILYDCVIGDDIVLPKQIKRIVFDHCKFDTVVTNIEFVLVHFKNCEFYNRDFSGCTFGHTKFSFCKLDSAIFSNCNISDTCFWCSDVRWASFNNANGNKVTFLSCDMDECEATDSNIVFPQHVPSEGSFIAWKKARMRDPDGDHFESTDVIIKLRIPDDAERCSANHKCRADKVEVIQYETLDGEKLPDNIYVHSFFNSSFVYHIGMIDSGEYDHDPQCECSGGIHFFLNRDDAVNYVF